MNRIGPIIILVSFLMNIYTMLVYFVFPYVDWINFKDDLNPNSKVVHLSLTAFYLFLLCMTFWSYLNARCSDPGYVPKDATKYDKGLLGKNEKIIWSYLEKLGYCDTSCGNTHETVPYHKMA